MRKSIILSLSWLGSLITFSILSHLFFMANAQAIALKHVLQPPSLAHLFGTDSLGRDIFWRIMCGGSVSLAVALVSVSVALIIGVFVGAVSGTYGGWVDRACMGLVNIFLCFPVFFLILAVMAMLGPSLINVMIIIGATSWMGTCRLVRSEILTLKEREFVMASRAFGAGARWIILKHLLPNSLGPALVNAVLGVSAAILTETALSFLGIGVQPPIPSWGNILADGRSVLGVAWWVTLFPGAMIFLTVLAINAVGEALTP